MELFPLFLLFPSWFGSYGTWEASQGQPYRVLAASGSLCSWREAASELCSWEGCRSPPRVVTPCVSYLC